MEEKHRTLKGDQMQSSLYVVACDDKRSSYLYDGVSDRNVGRFPYFLTKIHLDSN
jgi:hypothetical protein